MAEALEEGGEVSCLVLVLQTRAGRAEREKKVTGWSGVGWSGSVRLGVHVLCTV